MANLDLGQVYEETRAIAQGLIGLGLNRGDTIAIVGANRPRLYWSMTAAQMIGAVPVPVYADAVADEIAAVLGHSEATIIVAQDQEQVDKILSVRDRLPRLARLLYDEPRGLGDYDEPGLAPLAAIAAKGRAALADPAVAASLDRLIDAGKGSDPSVILYTSGTTGRSKGVVMSGERSIRAARRHGRFRPADRPRRGARLPAAGLGRRPLSQLRPRLCRRLLHRLPGKRGDGGQRPPRNRPDLSLRAAARLRGAADARADPHGGRRRGQALAVSRFLEVAKRWGEKIANGERRTVERGDWPIASAIS